MLITFRLLFERRLPVRPRVKLVPHIGVLNVPQATGETLTSAIILFTTLDVQLVRKCQHARSGEGLLVQVWVAGEQHLHSATGPVCHRLKEEILLLRTKITFTMLVSMLHIVRRCQPIAKTLEETAGRMAHTDTLVLSSGATMVEFSATKKTNEWD